MTVMQVLIAGMIVISLLLLGWFSASVDAELRELRGLPRRTPRAEVDDTCGL